MAFDFNAFGTAEKQKPKKVGGFDFESFGMPVSDVQSTQPQEGFVKSFVKGLARPVATLAARPIQLARALGGATEAEQAVELPFGLGKVETVTGAKDVVKDIGRAAETVALGVGGMAPKVGKGLLGASRLGRAVQTISRPIAGTGIRSVVPPPLPTAIKESAKIGFKGGALFGGGAAAEEGGGLGEIATGATIGAGTGLAFGAAIPVGIAGVQKGIGAVRRAATVTPQMRIQEMTRSLKSLQNAYDEGIKYTSQAGKRVERTNPIKVLGEKRLVPEVTPEGRVDATRAIQSLQDEIDNLAEPRGETISKSRKSVKLRDFKDEALKTIRQNRELQSSGMVGSTESKVNRLLRDFRVTFGSRLTLQTLDDIRITMNRRFDPELRDAFRAIGDAARKYVYKMDKTSRGILQQEGDLISAVRFLEAMNNKPVKGGRLGQYVSSILGGIVGGTTQIPVAGPIIGALGARALDRAIRQQYFRPIIPSLIQKAEGAIGGVAKQAKSVFGRKAPSIIPKVTGAAAKPQGAAQVRALGENLPKVINYTENAR